MGQVIPLLRMDLPRGFVVEHDQRGLSKTSARVSWGLTSALKMGWIEEPTPGTFRLGPNLWQEFYSDTNNNNKNNKTFI